MRALCFLVILVSLVIAFPALADEVQQIVITDPTGGYLAKVPGGLYIYGLFVMAAGLVSVFVKDSSMPTVLAKIVNFLAMNGGKAANDPAKNASKKA